MSIEELHLDIQELQRLFEFTNRTNVQALLTGGIEDMQTKLAKLRTANEEIPAPEDGKPKSNALLPVSKIRTYGWDQSEKFVKIYITLKGVHTLPKENIVIEYSNVSLKLLVRNIGNKNMEFTMNNLAGSIDGSSSSHKVKTDEIVLLLRKTSKKEWSTLTKKDTKASSNTPSPKMDANEDPSTGIMNMMKKMYDEGDDDMKRTIAKAWTEGRDKGGPGMNF